MAQKAGTGERSGRFEDPGATSPAARPEVAKEKEATPVQPLEAQADAEGCDPCGDLITTAKRVIRDPKVNESIGKLLVGTARAAKEEKDTHGQQNAALKHLEDLKYDALTSLANAVAGRDAVRAKGEPCRGQVGMSVAVLDGNTTIEEAIEELLKAGSTAIGKQRGSKTQFLAPEILKSIPFQLLDENLRIAEEGSRTFDAQGEILISEVEAGKVYLSFPADIFGGAEILPDFLITEPGGTTFKHYTTVTPTVGCPPLALTFRTRPFSLVATGGRLPYTYSIENDSHGFTVKSDTGKITVPTYLDRSITLTGRVVDDNNDTARAQRAINPKELGTLLEMEAASVTAQKSTVPTSILGFAIPVSPGLLTKVVAIARPPMAHVQCFSFMEGDDCCGQGKQYISNVAISAMQGDDFVACRQTGESGCSGFKLNPGRMYTFSAPSEISIAGCNYMLASSSPISAYLGAGQGCSDIYFSYKKKGSDIQVISEISSALGGDPYKAAKLNFPGMQYLLLREGDQTFAQQQTTTDGGAIYFRNLAAGTYILFCQAPARYGSQPVTPVSPANGRMSLRVFAGQTSSVPVLVKFLTSTTAPAVLDGYVRDDTGQPVPQQLVQVLDNANCLVAAGLTDANGFYSIQIYTADNLTILVGTQRIAVSKSQVQTAMQAVGTPALPAPGAALKLAVQTSELVREFQ